MMSATNRHHTTRSPGGAPAARDVAAFYERLVFPSRSSHPEYAALVPQGTGQVVGDFGCGASLFHEALRGYSPTPTFFDVSMNALRSIAHGNRVRGDVFALPFRTGAFDRIFCIGVVHHLPEPQAALQEIGRVLRAGGVLVLGVYAPGTLPALLRRLHDASRWRPWRRAVFGSTRALIGLRYRARGNPLAAADVDLRTRDFLEVPFVRYVEPDFYAGLAARAGFTLQARQRIAAMNVLELRRAERGA